MSFQMHPDRFNALRRHLSRGESSWTGNVVLSLINEVERIASLLEPTAGGGMSEGPSSLEAMRAWEAPKVTQMEDAQERWTAVFNEVLPILVKVSQQQAEDATDAALGRVADEVERESAFGALPRRWCGTGFTHDAHVYEYRNEGVVESARYACSGSADPRPYADVDTLAEANNLWRYWMERESEWRRAGNVARNAIREALTLLQADATDFLSVYNATVKLLEEGLEPKISSPVAAAERVLPADTLPPEAWEDLARERNEELALTMRVRDDMRAALNQIIEDEAGQGFAARIALDTLERLEGRPNGTETPEVRPTTVVWAQDIPGRVRRP